MIADGRGRRKGKDASARKASLVRAKGYSYDYSFAFPIQVISLTALLHGRAGERFSLGAVNGAQGAVAIPDSCFFSAQLARPSRGRRP